MPDPFSTAGRRYLVVLDPSADPQAVSADLSARGVEITSRLDAIRTLVVAVDPEAASAVTQVPGVKSIEPEGIVRAQE